RAAASPRRGHVSPRPLRPQPKRQRRSDSSEMTATMRSRLRIGLGVAALLSVAAAAGAAWWVASLGPPPLGKNLEVSTTVLDTECGLLRAYAPAEGRWRLPVTVADVDPRFFAVLFAYEDKRFRAHHGVDPLALVRAAVQLATSGHIRSGGST